ncbi:Bifunctional folate synthesis protein [Thalassocella blandensis]|nr:Bifunctional folate synthesis protein [Thalassocella blandensis]
MPWVSLGVGSNIEKERNIAIGLKLLPELLTNFQRSPVYESRALGFDGDNFLNCVVVGETELPVAALYRTLKDIEQKHGRRDHRKYSSKTLDIDILTYDDSVGVFESVVLPREEITTAAFVLKPLSDIWPDKLHPLLGKSYSTLWQEFERVDALNEESRQELWPVNLPELSTLFGSGVSIKMAAM